MKKEKKKKKKEKKTRREICEKKVKEATVIRVPDRRSMASHHQSGQPNMGDDGGFHVSKRIKIDSNELVTKQERRILLKMRLPESAGDGASGCGLFTLSL
ncbi:hypothetical protein GHT06_008256 [Daphnia sinensis]|uniref:Uncharacterized protein n=1 Tax=Daphnia sinensis TaxID=1820382 RepID=A0AAD5L3W3_9CRUS|nr:hypothetical protein GHT06_008256 [Daphnia sinensis]